EQHDQPIAGVRRAGQPQHQAGAKKANTRQPAPRNALSRGAFRLAATRGRATAAASSAANRISGAKFSEYSPRSSAIMRKGKLSTAVSSAGVKRSLTMLTAGAYGDWNQPFMSGNTGLPNSRISNASHGPAITASATAPPAMY